MEAGFAGMMLAAPDKHKVYVATTFYERLTRGKRIDVIQVYDDQTLKVVDEIAIPPRRAQALNYRSLMQANSNGELLYIQNATPATSVEVVDLKSKRQFETPNAGCYGIYPALKNPLRFTTLCGDGTMGTYTIAADKKSAVRKAGSKFFDADADAIYSHAERDSDAYLFLSYKGKLVEVGVDGDTAAPQAPIDIVGDITGGWAPGGYQPFALDDTSGVVYVLMHPNAVEGSHKNPSTEIWAYDLRNKKLLARSPAENFTSVTIGTSDRNVLFAINAVDSKIVRLTVDPQSRKVSPAGEIKLGETASLIEAPQ
jgi:methylamine dehydrogenase heavy chain